MAALDAAETAEMTAIGDLIPAVRDAPEPTELQVATEAWARHVAAQTALGRAPIAVPADADKAAALAVYGNAARLHFQRAYLDAPATRNAVIAGLEREMVQMLKDTDEAAFRRMDAFATVLTASGADAVAARPTLEGRIAAFNWHTGTALSAVPRLRLAAEKLTDLLNAVTLRESPTEVQKLKDDLTSATQQIAALTAAATGGRTTRSGASSGP
jgi:hypothetical protein